MENIFGKIALFSICVFITSCAFDGKGIEVLNKINEHYYVLKDGSADYGLQIGYSSDNENYQIISSDCNDIYSNRDTIMYSQILVQGGDTSYYIIPVKSEHDGLANDPIRIKESFFQSNVGRLDKVNIPVDKK